MPKEKLQFFSLWWIPVHSRWNPSFPQAGPQAVTVVKRSPRKEPQARWSWELGWLFWGPKLVPLSDEIHGDIPMKNGGIHLLTYLGRGLWGSFPLGMNQRFWGLGWLMDFEDLDGTNGDFYGTSWGSNMARLLGHLISKFSKITTWWIFQQTMVDCTEG